MLERLYIKNVALIEEADVEFDGKFNVLSGETGSGKSVILDSINFVLGSKADKSMIRYGALEATVKAEFSVDADSEVCRLLQELDIETDGAIVISRRLNSEGRGAIKVNGDTVTASMLKKIAAHLVDVHGQSEHFYLLNESNQLNMVDCLCGEKLSVQKNKLAQLLSKKKQYLISVSMLGGSEQERAQKLDLLAYQIKEIEEADIKDGELDALKAKKKLYDNAERVISALNVISGILASDNGCADMLSAAYRQACAISELDDEYQSVCERLDNLSIEVSDLSETVTDIIDGFSFDESEARAVDERLTLLKKLISKYGQDEQSVLTFLSDAKNKYDSLNDASAELERLNAQIERANEEIYCVCYEITKIRKNACVEFCGKVEEELRTLNIPNAKFYVQFKEYGREDFIATANGADAICFMFSANKGEPPKPLDKVISGGEMSRFMLAVKTRLKGLNGISTYIFDEIDAGISGVTAKTVADKFVAISGATQIIAVSHLPQVCAAASAQYLISKCENAENKTVTSIKRLDRQERINEIVRLTGSISTEAAKAHAEELLKQFNN